MKIYDMEPDELAVEIANAVSAKLCGLSEGTWGLIADATQEVLKAHVAPPSSYTTTGGPISTVNMIPAWKAVGGTVGRDENGWSLALLVREQDHHLAAAINADIKRAFILGMEFAMRICRNQEESNRPIRREHADGAGLCAGVIRIVQVEVGADRMPLPQFTLEEKDEVERIR